MGIDFLKATGNCTMATLSFAAIVSPFFPFSFLLRAGMSLYSSSLQSLVVKWLAFWFCEGLK